ncbi:hypothetical protein TgHK011_008935 [Trichoderma gracile]|nr:hypothetical protein TgHK011_008935 [Trichoderma gracile]
MFHHDVPLNHQRIAHTSSYAGGGVNVEAQPRNTETQSSLLSRSQPVGNLTDPVRSCWGLYRVIATTTEVPAAHTRSNERARSLHEENKDHRRLFAVSFSTIHSHPASISRACLDPLPHSVLTTGLDYPLGIIRAL